MLGRSRRLPSSVHPAQPRQRRLRGTIAAHAMHASTWWSGRRANIDIARRCDDRGHISRRSDLRPIPQGGAPGFAGLFTVDLPLTVKTGQEFNIVVRRISKRLPPIPQGPPLHRFLIALHSPDALIETGRRMCPPEKTIKKSPTARAVRSHQSGLPMDNSEIRALFAYFGVERAEILCS